jgi:NAD(P)H-dependent FMN reductase
MKVQIIIGSTRPGRVSDKVAKWVANGTKEVPDVSAELVDLADYQLPYLDEPISPQFNPEREPNAEAKKFLAKISEADAYILVTPEYNRSYSAVLKNAIDYIDFQFAKKPVALVAHGSTGGAQAIAHLRGVLPGLKSITTPSATFIVGSAGTLIDDAGNITDEAVRTNPYGPTAALKNMLTELKWYSDALSAARSAETE